MHTERSNILHEVDLVESHGIELTDVHDHQSQPDRLLQRPPKRETIFATPFCRGAMIAGGIVFFIVTLASSIALRKSHDKYQAQTVVDEKNYKLLKDAFSTSEDYRGHPRTLSNLPHAAVAADHSRCSDLGLSIMKHKNGNAVDALVTTALCQGVYGTQASGIGGGGFIVVREASSGETHTIDAREPAPASADKDMFDKPEQAQLGGLAVGVPMEVKGLWEAHQQWGTVRWEALVEPVVALARDGFEAHPYLVALVSFVGGHPMFTEMKGMTDAFMVKEGGKYRAPKVGEVCCARPKLGALLERLGKEGVDALYGAETARVLAQEIQDAGGEITEEDLVGSEVVVQEPFVGEAFGYTVKTMSLPSSGPLMVLGLKILEHLWQYSATGNKPLALPEPELVAHHVIESMKHMFGARMSLGDPMNTDVMDEILNDINNQQYVEDLVATLKDSTTLPPKTYGGKYAQIAPPPTDGGTSHISIVDPKGNAVGMTTSVNGPFGSAVLSPSTQILFNNQMDDFSSPKFHNVYGVPPSEANYIKPGKRPLSSMSPTIVEKDGELVAVLGGSGGTRILSAVYQVIVRLITSRLSSGESIGTIVNTARFHDQVYPNVTQAEHIQVKKDIVAISTSVLMSLKSKHHNVSDKSAFGGQVQAIVVDDGAGQGRTLTAVSDFRKDGAPAGW